MLEGNLAARKLTGKINGLDVIYTDTYEIAVKNGYQGTIDEWLASLKGKDGTNGKDGVGIEDIEFTTPSSEPGGENCFVIYLTDGRQETFHLMNGKDGASIRHCKFSGELAASGTFEGYDLFPTGTPKVNDLFATASGYLGRVISVSENVEAGAVRVVYVRVADLNAKSATGTIVPATVE